MVNCVNSAGRCSPAASLHVDCPLTSLVVQGTSHADPSLLGMLGPPTPSSSSLPAAILPDDTALAPGSPEPHDSRATIQTAPSDPPAPGDTALASSIQIPKFRVIPVVMGPMSRPRPGIEAHVHLPGIRSSMDLHVYFLQQPQQLIVLAGIYQLRLHLNADHGCAIRDIKFQPRRSRLVVLLEVPLEPELPQLPSPEYGWGSHPADTNMEAARAASMRQHMLDFPNSPGTAPELQTGSPEQGPASWADPTSYWSESAFPSASMLQERLDLFQSLRRPPANQPDSSNGSEAGSDLDGDNVSSDDASPARTGSPGAAAAPWSEIFGSSSSLAECGNQQADGVMPLLDDACSAEPRRHGRPAAPSSDPLSSSAARWDDHQGGSNARTPNDHSSAAPTSADEPAASWSPAQGSHWGQRRHQIRPGDLKPGSSDEHSGSTAEAGAGQMTHETMTHTEGSHQQMLAAQSCDESAGESMSGRLSEGLSRAVDGTASYPGFGSAMESVDTLQADGQCGSAGDVPAASFSSHFFTKNESHHDDNRHEHQSIAQDSPSIVRAAA